MKLAFICRFQNEFMERQRLLQKQINEQTKAFENFFSEIQEFMQVTKNKVVNKEQLTDDEEEFTKLIQEIHNCDDRNNDSKIDSKIELKGGS